MKTIIKRNPFYLIVLICVLFITSCAKPRLDIQEDGSDILTKCSSGEITRIHTIQGAGHRSPLEGKQVSCVTGIVTAVSGQGFFLQDLITDDDERTSEGIFVAYDIGMVIKKGDRIFIKEARVQEHNPSINQSNSLTITRLIDAELEVIDRFNALPEPVLLGEGGRAIPNQVIENDVNGYVGKDKGLFDPQEDGMDFFESLEGMYVEVRDAVAVTSTNRFKEVSVLADNEKNAGLISDSGVIVIREDDYNPERLLLDDSFIQMPNLLLGTRFLAPIRGIISYDFTNYRLLPTEKLIFEPANHEIAKVDVPQKPTLSIATYNVENFSATDDPSRFTQFGRHVVDGLGSPDILVLEEVLDDDGAVNSKTVSAEQTLRNLIQAIVDQGGPEYKVINIDPERNSDGGIKGGNGRVVILYRDDKGLTFNPIPGAGARTETEVRSNEGRAMLSHNPGRIWPQNGSFRNSRKALIAQFDYQGESIFVIGVHFSSKGEDGPLFGEIQPPPVPSENRRIAQAKAINGFVKRIFNAEPNAKIVVLGDINDFYWSDTVKTLMGTQLKNTAMTIPEKNRYTYIHEGNGQMMDQIFLSETLYQKIESFQVIHLNTSQIELDAFSDHDPVIVYLHFE